MKKIISVLLCAVFIFCFDFLAASKDALSSLFSFGASAVNDGILAYCPAGSRDLALDADVESSSPYYGSNGWWKVENINDGCLQRETGGFTTSTQEDVPDENTPAWILFDLEGYYDLTRVVLFAYGAYPDSYRLEVSEDGESFTQAAGDTGLTGNRDNKQYDISASRVRYFRLYVTKRGSLDGNAIHLVQFSEIAVFGTECAPTDSGYDVISYAPENSVNLAPESTVTCSDCIENTSIGIANLSDGVVNNGKFFSTKTHGEDSGMVDIDFDLNQYAKITRICPFTWGIYPKAFEVQVSLDGETYTTVASASGLGRSDKAYITLPENTYASHVRIHITERNHGSGSELNMYYVQFGEIAVFGIKNAFDLNIDKRAITIAPGKSMTVNADFSVRAFDTSNHGMIWSSDNSSVASVASDGTITAVSEGLTICRVTDPVSGICGECEVIVKTNHFDYTDNVITSAYGPEWGDMVNDEQYKLIADAGMDLIFNRTGDYQINRKSVDLAHKYGMYAIVADGEMLNDTVHNTCADLETVYNRYKNMSGLGGIYLIDEPRNPNSGFVKIYNYLKEIDPELYVHLNFLPGFVYDSYEQYEYQLDDFAALTKNTDYLMFDIYPFLYPQGVQYKMMFDSYNAIRKAGLKNDVKTACYIQLVGYGSSSSATFAKRVPNAAEIMYQDMISLAYGMKHLSYFKWGAADSNTSERFSDGGINAQGAPSDNYYNVQAANNVVHALGKTLKDLDAREVYLTGSDIYGQDAVPSGFFVRYNGNASLVLSYMRDKNTGRNYLMVVNNDISDSVTAPLVFADGINSIAVADNTTGSFTETAVNNHTYELQLEAGSAALIALPEGYDYGSTPSTESSNKALGKPIIEGDSSIGEDGWYYNCMTDGRYDASAENGLSGWCSVPADSAYSTEFTIDLGASEPFNNIKVYPVDSSTGCRDFFPAAFSVYVSDDRENWIKVGASSGLSSPDIVELTMEETRARYIKFVINDMNSVDGEYAAAIGEIEVTDELKISRVKTVADGLNGYYAYAQCDGADSARMPTWTELNGQDDLIWYDAEKGSWTIDSEVYNFRRYVPVSEHNGEYGKYITHVYAYKGENSHSVASEYYFMVRADFDLNYPGAPHNYVCGLDSVSSSNGLDMSFDTSDDTLTIDGDVAKSTYLQNFVPFNRELNKNDKVSITIDVISGSAEGVTIVVDLVNTATQQPSTGRVFKDMTANDGTWVIDINSDAAAREIKGYRFWIYKNGNSVQSFDNFKFRLSIEINGDGDGYSPQGRYIMYNSAYGEFFAPQRYDAEFLGWYTQPQGGTIISPGTVNTNVGGIRLYAHWNEVETQYLFASGGRLSRVSFENAHVGQGMTVAYTDAAAGGYLCTGCGAEVKNQAGRVTARYVIVIPGDVNCDSICDGMDSVLISCVIEGMLDEASLGRAAYLAADCNRDGVTDGSDADAARSMGLLL
ncbi:MAG: discoidin domain-containing protein [Clostridia bacterium]|nr:discoidin domain-containing protein [Clostridia bacterium]